MFGAFRKDTQDYILPTSVTRGAHTCPVCLQDVILRTRMIDGKRVYGFDHKGDSVCTYYSLEPPPAHEKTHVIHVLRRNFLRGNYVLGYEPVSNSMGAECDSTESFIELAGVEKFEADPATDRFLTDYVRDDGFVFDVAILGADGSLRAAFKMYDTFGPEDARTCPDDLVWVEHSCDPLGIRRTT